MLDIAGVCFVRLLSGADFTADGAGAEVFDA
jgi:hypothetical protein